jgi:response regulator of citrate/malate metabolism
VFVSAYNDIKTVVQTVKAGAEDFLLKPVTSGVLCSRQLNVRSLPELILIAGRLGHSAV